MAHILDDEEGEFLVLVNGAGQHSLWPAKLAVPAGWGQAGPKGRRAECLAWIELHWNDITLGAAGEAPPPADRLH